MDVDALRRDMEFLRDSLVSSKRIDDHQIWPLVDRASLLLDIAKGGPFEDQLQQVYGLLSAIWATTRSQARMRKAAGGK